jgi:hypothetical protein
MQPQAGSETAVGGLEVLWLVEYGAATMPLLLVLLLLVTTVLPRCTQITSVRYFPTDLKVVPDTYQAQVLAGSL